MSRGSITPKEKQYRKLIAENLQKLLARKQYRQIDIVRGSGISATSLNGYLHGTRLPTPENIEKLANFFHVDKSEIDPRFSTQIEAEGKISDLDDTLYYNGKEIPDKYKKIIKDLMDMDDD